MNDNTTFKSDFDKIWALIESGVPFCHARYADGEIALMKGNSINRGSQATDVDNWSAPPSLTRLGIDLKASLLHTERNYFYAISCDCCDIHGKNYLLSHIKQDLQYITYSNLWINGNYKLFLSKLQTLKSPVVMLANKDGENRKYPFELDCYLGFDDNCVEQWESNSEDIKNILTSAFKDYYNKTFFISVGPMSEVIIDHLWKINPRNQYIDVGSAVDEYVHGKITRPYMYTGSVYSKQECILNL